MTPALQSARCPIRQRSGLTALRRRRAGQASFKLRSRYARPSVIRPLGRTKHNAQAADFHDQLVRPDWCQLTAKTIYDRGDRPVVRIDNEAVKPILNRFDSHWRSVTKCKQFKNGEFRFGNFDIRSLRENPPACQIERQRTSAELRRLGPWIVVNERV